MLTATILLVTMATSCRRAATPPASAISRATSADCRSCHEAIFQAWASSHHAHAHRPVSADRDRAAFAAMRELSLPGAKYQFDWKNGQPEFVLGHMPLRQYVVPTARGRSQMTELAYDPAKREWFNVFGEERRQPGEWGHWQGRGMNWNSMCAPCHLTEFNKNYDPAHDSYASTWREHGVGCAQCHHDLPADHGRAGSPTRPPDRQRAQETCAPCHARNELLTGDIVAGGAYHDHYRLTLPAEPAMFYPDGQMRDEVFNYTSHLFSRMGGKAGVTCLDCHDPHSGRPRLPVDNNALCLQCHGPTPQHNAPSIEPLAHSRHAAETTGHRCVSCHMPTTTYMQRDPRHDHAFTKPDPLLTKELGIPNACNRCHAEQTVDWAIAHTDRWYGKKMESRQRQRARAIAAVQRATARSADPLLELLATEDIPAWRATLLQLARPFATSDARVGSAAKVALNDPHPLVRSAAVQVLGLVPDELPTLRPLLRDPARVVRLDAAWALTPELAENASPRSELEAYLRAHADQPAGQLRIAQDLFNRGRAIEAEAPVRKAAAWDPNSADVHHTLGQVLNTLGRDAEAAAAFWRAAQLDSDSAEHAFHAALAFAAAQKPADAELALRETVRRDPQHHRAWYNLGLLLHQAGRSADALAALDAAEGIAPDHADYPYARATILWQQGQRSQAAAAARRALAIDPQHAAASELLRDQE